MDVGAFVKKVRNEYFLTQEQFSMRLGVSNSYISKIERNKVNPSLKFLKILSKEFSVPLQNFFK
ncbi:helix-turn-helix domain-containing protein [Bacillus altitudinis]|uniref:helix-turn-helix domain-containing protein n=1 Tax=Bacillus altitudinis TaxID=293387 RepID=UPI003F7697E6